MALDKSSLTSSSAATIPSNRFFNFLYSNIRATLMFVVYEGKNYEVILALKNTNGCTLKRVGFSKVCNLIKYFCSWEIGVTGLKYYHLRRAKT